VQALAASLREMQIGRVTVTRNAFHVQNSTEFDRTAQHFRHAGVMRSTLLCVAELPHPLPVSVEMPIRHAMDWAPPILGLLQKAQV